MKTLVTTALLALGLSFGALAADTNTVAAAESGRQVPFTVEITLGGGGGTTTVNGETSFGADFSISTNPFKDIPSIWVSVTQGLSWEPTFSGSTDLSVDYSFLIYKESLYLNVGWSGGAVYDTESLYWRTGPEATLQYYLTDNAFIYLGANYDFNLDKRVSDGIRYGFGIGLSF